MPLRILAREDWGAKPAISSTYLRKPVTHVVTSVTNTEQCYTVKQGKTAMKALQGVHFYKRMRDIKYNFVIANEGIVYEGRGWTIEPAILKRNLALQNCALFIAFFWNYNSDDPPDSMYKTLDELIIKGISHKFISTKFLHHYLKPY